MRQDAPPRYAKPAPKPSFKDRGTPSKDRKTTSPSFRGRKTEEVSRGPVTNKGPICTIIAIFIGIVVIGLAVLVVFSTKDVESIAVGNVEKDAAGIWFEVYTTAKGLSKFSGDCTIEILYIDPDTEAEELMTSSKGKIKEDKGVFTVPYIDFVMRNGDYKVVARAGDQDNWAPLRITTVVEALDLDWEGYNSDTSRMTPDYKIGVSITYMAGGREVRPADGPMLYTLTAQVVSPDGSRTDISSSDYTPGLLKLQKAIPHTMKGSYSISGTLINDMCSPDSPFKTISITENRQFSYDARPFANAGQDQEVALASGAAIVDLDAGQSWDDGTIAEYRWDFGDGATLTSSTPNVRHSYSAQGTYYVTLVVVDDSEQTSDENAEVSLAQIDVV